MIKIFNYNQFINEEVKTHNDYAVGDVVMVRYYLTGDITPVKIVSKKTHNYFIVSHKLEGSNLQNAPDNGIQVSEIIGRIKSVADPIGTTDRYTENPHTQPDTSGLIPGGDSFSNDISI